MTYHVEPEDHGAHPPRRATRYVTGEWQSPRFGEDAPLLQLLANGAASCAADPDPDRWVGGGGGSSELRRLCGGCALRQPCLLYALAHEVEGIWGGTNKSERKRLRRAQDITAEPLGFTIYARSLS